ncbi:MAG: exodeoxyribonuclease VII small subunit [Atopobiaceae bacterium]|nr:exodeoxyribonuclease VII small subunit [Atopobiaceae bacterium]
MAGTNGMKPVEELSFKEASIELEMLVRQLESGELELEDALKAYDRGVELLSSLKQRLAEAEQKVQVLLDASTETVPDTTSAPSTVFVSNED